MPNRNIVLVRIDSLGDLVLSLPAVYALQKAVPSSSLTLVVNEQNVPLVSGLPYIKKVIGVKREIFSLIKTAWILQSAHFDTAFHLLPGSDTAGSFLVAVSNASQKVGYDVGPFKNFYSHRLKPLKPGYEADTVMSIIKTVFPGVMFCGWGIESDKEADREIKSILICRGVQDGEACVVLHPGVSRNNERKMWPLKNYTELAKKILDTKKTKIILIGTQDEKLLTSRIAEAVPGAIDLTGIIGLKQLFSLLRHSCLFIGNNSGPLHLAVAAGIPTVSLIGPSLVERWAPRGNMHTVVKSTLPCSPCEGSKTRCEDGACMSQISVETVFFAAREKFAHI